MFYGTQRRTIRTEGQKLHQDGFLSHLKVQNVRILIVGGEEQRVTPVFLPTSHLILQKLSKEHKYKACEANWQLCEEQPSPQRC